MNITIINPFGGKILRYNRGSYIDFYFYDAVGNLRGNKSFLPHGVELRSVFYSTNDAKDEGFEDNIRITYADLGLCAEERPLHGYKIRTGEQAEQQISPTTY